MTKPNMKSIILRPHEVRRLASAGEVQVWRAVKPRPEDLWREVFPSPRGPLSIVPYESDTWDTAWRDGKCWMLFTDGSNCRLHVPPCPYGVPGERRFAKETWWHEVGTDFENAGFDDGTMICKGRGRFGMFHVPGPWAPTAPAWRKRPSTHMPRWASRFTVELDAVRVARVQEIDIKTARKAGCCKVNPVIEFKAMWDSHNTGIYRWAESPWAWCCGLKKVAT